MELGRIDMPDSDLERLNSRHSIPGELQFRNGAGNMPMAIIDNVHCTGSLSLYGAHLVDWTPRGREPVLWLSPRAKFAQDAAIRGGVPICWPWFGSHPSEPGFPAHGIARTGTWRILETARKPDGATFISLRLVPGHSDLQLWPHDTPVEIQFTLGETLQIALITRNLGEAPVVFSQALHAYFQVEDVRSIEVLGLDGLEYIDKVLGGIRGRLQGPLSFASEVDRIFLGSTADCRIADPGYNRIIRIAKQGSSSTIVWNPWAENSAKMADMESDGYLRMVCVESANAADDSVTLLPGNKHCLGVSYSVQYLQDR